MHKLTITLSLDEIAALDRSIRHSIRAHLSSQQAARERIHDAIKRSGKPNYAYEASLKRHAADIASLRRVQAALNRANYDERRENRMKGIAVTYVLSDEQWARLDALAERCHDAGMLDEHHSAHELLGFALRANGAETVDARLDAMERDLAEYGESTWS